MNRPLPFRLSQRLTMGRALETRAAQTPDAPFLAFTETGASMSFGAFNEEVNRLAHGLIGLGVRQGDIAALTMRTRPEYLVTSYALKKIGAIEAGINGAYDAGKIAEQLDTLRPRWAFVDGVHQEKLRPLLGALDGLEATIVVDGASGVAAQGGAGAIHDWRELRADRAGDLPNVDDMDVAMIIMSSGTTGLSKAIQLTHRMACVYADGLTAAYGLDADDRVYVPWPLFHATGSICDVFTALYAGAGAILAPRFSTTAFWDHVRTHRATWASSLGILQKALWNAAPRDDDRHHSLRLIWGGPHPIPREAFRERFGVDASLGYGTSEIGLVNFQQPEDPEESFGRVRSDVYEIRIVDEDGTPVPHGARGEIVCRGVIEGAVTPGYLGRPELNARTIRDGWFHTGDIGMMDQAGHLYYLERKDSMIRHKGMLVAPADVEDLIERHPDVRASAVTRVPGELGDHDICAFVELVPGSRVDGDEIRAFCRKNGPSWFTPAQVRIVPEIPLTGTGKPAIAELQRLMGSD